MTLWLLEESSQGLTTRQIARSHGVSERTARRDLAGLRASGYPVVSLSGRWYLVGSGVLPSFLPRSGLEMADDAKALTMIERATRARWYLRLQHLGPGGRDPIRMTVAPLALRALDGSLFLLCHEVPPGPFRVLAFERLGHLALVRRCYPKRLAAFLDTVSDERFRREASRELVRVTVKLSSRRARWLEERLWHPTQRVVTTSSGELRISFRVPGFSWVRAWALALGPEAVVIEPPELVAELCRELAETHEAYRAAASTLPQLDLFSQRAL